MPDSIMPHYLITGGSKGVGAALTRAVIEQGGRVTIAARASAELDALIAETGAQSMPVDLSNRAEVTDYIDRVEHGFGPVDVLVNNAAMVKSGQVDQLSADELYGQLLANLWAPMELCRQILPRMLNRGKGRIANISSMAAEVAIPNLPAYVATKAGLTKFTLDLQGDMRRRKSNLGVALFVLGEIPGTQINRGFRADAAVAGLADKFAKLPVLRPESVADAVIDAVQTGGQRIIVLPRYNAPIFHLRNLAVRLTGKLIK